MIYKFTNVDCEYLLVKSIRSKEYSFYSLFLNEVRSANKTYEVSIPFMNSVEIREVANQLQIKSIMIDNNELICLNTKYSYYNFECVDFIQKSKYITIIQGELMSNIISLSFTESLAFLTKLRKIGGFF